jgi:uncharacterized repeat protein (TIGR03806 family)
MHRPEDSADQTAPKLSRRDRVGIWLAIFTALAASLLVAQTSELQSADGAPAKQSAQKSGPPAAVQKREKTPAAALPHGVRWTTSRVVGSPEPPHPYRLQRAFPYHKFHNPVYLTPEPGTDRLFVMEYSEPVVRAIKDDANSKEETEILKFPAGTEKKAEAFSIAFHPNYVQNRLLYIFANVRNLKGPRDEHNQVFRFRVDTAPPYKIVPESGKVIIEWASAGHDGGDLGFGPDGFLYITAGDGTTGSDPDITGQDLTDLRASMLRIDVDHPANGKPYGIPNDNPFLQIPKARPEIWAFGLRAPWRMSFDMPTGNLWVGEVGQDLWEMIHLIRRGGNYGWSVMEGTHPFYPERKIGPAPISPPIVEHHHSEARSITGGYVYHGKRLPELANYYLYCCYQMGTVWAFRYEDGRVVDHHVLAHSTYHCASWGRDHAGEVYLVALSGEIFRLEANPAAKAGAAPFPQRLSETGLFTSVGEQRPAPGVIPYSVNAPGWHDGAGLTRLFAVPNDDTIDPNTSRGWDFMDGAVLVQTLSLEMEKGNPASRKNIETRMLTHQGGEWFGYSYAWDESQTDAHLVPKEGQERKLRIRDAAAIGGTRQQTWHYLSRAECMVCHSRAANFVLGLCTLEMNHTEQHGAVAVNQLSALSSAGYFQPPLKMPAAGSPKLVNPYDPSADLEARVRSYLHINCSQCHVADGGGNARMELEFTTPRDKMNVIGVPPLQGKFGIPDAELIAPGDPFRSVMLYRISKLGGGRMPQAGSSMVDHQAVDLFHRWIRSLPTKGSDAASQARLAEQRKEEVALASLQSGHEAPPAPGEHLDRLLSSTSGSMRLLRAVDQQRLHPAVKTKAIQTASAHPNPVVRDLFERFVPEEKRTPRLGTSINAARLLALAGSAPRGGELFFNASAVNCQTCHQVGGKGRDVGPDLSHIGKKYNRAQILENLLDPSKTIEQKYIVYTVQTADGKAYTGILAERNAESAALKDAQGNIVKFRLKEVESFDPQKKSLMPDNLLRDLTAEQAADLLAYLESLK